MSRQDLKREEVRNSSFWIDNNGEHPDRMHVLYSGNVVESPSEAVNGKWAATNPELREPAVDFVKAQSTFQKPLIVR